MEPAGMVHALEQIHRLLVPGGHLVDIHPCLVPCMVEIRREDTILWSQPYPRCFFADFRQANKALAHVLSAGLFIRIRRRRFDFLIAASSVDELCEYNNLISSNEEPSPGDVEAAREKEFFLRVEEIMKELGGGLEVATHDRTQISLMKAVK